MYRHCIRWAGLGLASLLTLGTATCFTPGTGMFGSRFGQFDYFLDNGDGFGNPFLTDPLVTDPFVDPGFVGPGIGTGTGGLGTGVGGLGSGGVTPGA